MTADTPRLRLAIVAIDDLSLFAAFGPTSNPQHTVTVVMDQAGFGASSEFVQSNGAGD